MTKCKPTYYGLDIDAAGFMEALANLMPERALEIRTDISAMHEIASRHKICLHTYAHSRWDWWRTFGYGEQRKTDGTSTS